MILHNLCHGCGDASRCSVCLAPAVHDGAFVIEGRRLVPLCCQQRIHVARRLDSIYRVEAVGSLLLLHGLIDGCQPPGETWRHVTTVERFVGVAQYRFEDVIIAYDDISARSVAIDSDHLCRIELLRGNEL